ncbi:MAG: PEGA domain-containing protein [Desulfobaccales bacterium]
MSRLNALLIFSLLIMSSGCATIMHGTTQDIGITTDPFGADLLVDGKDSYKSPATITMSRKDSHVVEVSKEGYQKETINIKQAMSLATAGDVFAGGIIGYAVDAATGAQCQLVPENAHVQLRPLTAQAVTPFQEAPKGIENKFNPLTKPKEKEE